MTEHSRFEEHILPHLDAAYNLARWLTRNADDAQDVVQEALLRALKYFKSYRGGSTRSWLLVIVRNTAYSWMDRRRAHAATPLVEEELPPLPEPHADPEHMLLQGARRQQIHQAVLGLPIEFREAIILRELEGLSYKEIADIAGIPVGTVMSRLARGRAQLQQTLMELRSTL